MRKLVLFIFLFSLQSFATDQFLVQATNDEDNEVTKLYLELDENSDIVRFKKKTFSDSSLVNQEEYGQLGVTNSIVVEERKGRDILILESDNFSSHQGANVSLVYLYNGITKSTGEFSMNLERNGDVWSLTSEGQKLTHLHLVSNKKFMVGTIGIKYIQIVE